MLRVLWPDKMTNGKCLRKANVEKKRVKSINKCHPLFVVLLRRSVGLENTRTTEKVNRKRGRGRQRRKI